MNNSPIYVFKMREDYQSFYALIFDNQSIFLKKLKRKLTRVAG